MRRAQKFEKVAVPAKPIIGLIGHDKSICDLMRHLRGDGFRIGGVQTFRRHIHEKDGIEWTGYLREKGLYESVFDFTAEHKIEILEVDDVNAPSAMQWFLDRGVNMVLSCSCRWILKKSFLEKFGYLVVNFHPTILPGYGGGPAQTWQVLNREKKGGWTAHWIGVGVDKGDIICQIEYSVPPDADPLVLLNLRHKYSARFFSLFSRLLGSGELPKIEPDLDTRKYFFSLYTPRDARIDFSWSAEEVEVFIRAFGFPYAGAFGFFRKSSGEIVKVHVAKSKRVNMRGLEYFHPFAMGNVLRYTKDHGVLVNLRKGVIEINTVRDGAEEMAADKVLRMGGRFINDYCAENLNKTVKVLGT